MLRDYRLHTASVKTPVLQRDTASTVYRIMPATNLRTDVSRTCLGVTRCLRTPLGHVERTLVGTWRLRWRRESRKCCRTGLATQRHMAAGVTGRLRVPLDLALNQPLSKFALAAVGVLDPASETFALDVVSVIERRWRTRARS